MQEKKIKFSEQMTEAAVLHITRQRLPGSYKSAFNYKKKLPNLEAFSGLFSFLKRI